MGESKSVMRRVASQRSGRLKDHTQPCPECEGLCPECESCDGEGKLFWGSWYFQDYVECEECKKELPCANMDQQEPEGWWVCYDCYVEAHEKHCGCSLWRKEAQRG